MIVLSSQDSHAPPSPARYVRQAALAAPRLAPSVAGLSATDHELTVIIPAYNEQSRLPKSLATLADFLDPSKIDYRVLVADDGSRDQTARVTDSLGPRFSTLRLARNGGKGCAVRTAMLAATGQVVAFTDADMPYDLQALRQGYDWIRENQCEVVFGDRSADQSGAVVERRFVRKVATVTFKEVVKRLVSTELCDTQCGLKLFSRRAAIEIFSRARVDGFAFDAEVVMLALRLSLRCRRLSVRLVNEHASTVSLVRHALPMLLDVIRVRIRLGRQPLVPRFGEGWGRLPGDRPQLAA